MVCCRTQVNEMSLRQTEANYRRIILLEIDRHAPLWAVPASDVSVNGSKKPTGKFHGQKNLFGSDLIRVRSGIMVVGR